MNAENRSLAEYLFAWLTGTLMLLCMPELLACSPSPTEDLLFNPSQSHATLPSSTRPLPAQVDPSARRLDIPLLCLWSEEEGAPRSSRSHTDLYRLDVCDLAHISAASLEAVRAGMTLTRVVPPTEQMLNDNIVEYGLLTFLSADPVEVLALLDDTSLVKSTFGKNLTELMLLEVADREALLLLDCDPSDEREQQCAEDYARAHQDINYASSTFSYQDVCYCQGEGGCGNTCISGKTVEHSTTFRYDGSAIFMVTNLVWSSSIPVIFWKKLLQDSYKIWKLIPYGQGTLLLMHSRLSPGLLTEGFRREIEQAGPLQLERYIESLKGAAAPARPQG